MSGTAEARDHTTRQAHHRHSAERVITTRRERKDGLPLGHSWQ
jgi:hypothetical protein